MLIVPIFLRPTFNLFFFFGGGRGDRKAPDPLVEGIGGPMFNWMDF